MSRLDDRNEIYTERTRGRLRERGPRGHPAQLSCGPTALFATIGPRRPLSFTETHPMNAVRFDAPFWLFVLTGFVFVGSVSCFGLAAAAQSAIRSDAALVAVD
ncbi:MAG: hypothetical protein BGO98_00975 [Myxococcales bacterium 68-20]|nr:MAG: hypothetical protein BGO98_00975 [Myxococcales bacterium 68-20]